MQGLALLASPGVRGAVWCPPLATLVAEGLPWPLLPLHIIVQLVSPVYAHGSVSICGPSSPAYAALLPSLGAKTLPVPQLDSLLRTGCEERQESSVSSRVGKTPRSRPLPISRL